MKAFQRFLLILSFALPLLVVPYLAKKADNWYYLIAIASYLLGVVMFYYKQIIFFFIPLLFCLWFWYEYGFGIHDYVFFLFAWMCLGGIMVVSLRELNRFITRTMPENEQNDDYNSKVIQMNALLEEYKRKHPDQKITQEIIEEIRTSVFFGA